MKKRVFPYSILAFAFLISSLRGASPSKSITNPSSLEKRLRSLEEELAKFKSNVSDMNFFLIPSWLAVGLGGQYRVMGNSSNFDWHSKSISKKQPSSSFINQRFRTWLNLHEKKKQRVGVYLQLEIGHNMWGDDTEAPKTHLANGNEVGLELRRGFLWLKIEKQHLLRVGIQAWHDRFGERPDFKKNWLFSVDHYDSSGAILANSIWDFNVGGISLTGSFGKAHYRTGWFLLGMGTTFTGDNSANLLSLDMDMEIGAHLLGGSVYYLLDRGDYSYGNFGGPKVSNYDHSWDLWTGIRAHFSFFVFHLSFFVIYNHGEVAGASYQHDGWALKSALKVDLRKVGKFRFQTLYSTGSKGREGEKSFRTIAQSERDDLGSQGYWSFLGLTSPWGPSDVKDLGVGLQNQGLGLLTIQISYERALLQNLRAYLGLGWLQSAASNPINDKKDMGFETFFELSWNIYEMLSLKIGSSYLITGNFYKTPNGGNPDDLWESYFRLQMEF
ncbi:MAG: hypothetical protein D6805_08540 [Planctomycetota bacterium]|nr:MAG: hypothetical protein D6805_08540 [Planctomycetota bacterium]